MDKENGNWKEPVMDICWAFCYDAKPSLFLLEPISFHVCGFIFPIQVLRNRGHAQIERERERDDELNMKIRRQERERELYLNLSSS